MSAKTRRPTPTEKLVRVKDLFPVLRAINSLEARVRELEAERGGAAVLPDGGYTPTEPI